MFTGIITDLGVVRGADKGQFRISCKYDPASIAIGASIACDGCCLTVTNVDVDGEGQTVFDVEASNETLARTTLGRWRAGTRVNLERSLKLSDEMGGHLVTGHVDGVAEIASIKPDGNSMRFEIECPQALAKFVAAKGSVALAGTSLTVNTVGDNRFTVNIIPHTLAVTSWGQMTAGQPVNMEVDLIARYVARLTAVDADAGGR
jgi:riboflavin synthase